MNCEKIIQSGMLSKISAEKLIEAEIAVPDYYPGVFRVLQVFTLPLSGRVSAGENGVSAEGVLRFTLLYLPEDGKGICSVTHDESFSCFVAGGITDCTVKAQVQYASCRLLSPRRASLKAMLGVSLVAPAVNEAEICKPDDSLITLEREIECDLPVCCAKKLFALSEEAHIRESVGAPLYTDVKPVLKEARAVNGRVMIKGEAHIRTLYVCNDDSVKSLSLVLPFSQVIDAQGAAEKDNCRVLLSVSDTETSFTPSENDALMEYDITLLAFVSVTRKARHTAVADCFSLTHSVDIEKAPFRFTSLAHQKTFTGDTALEMPLADGVRNVLDTRCILRTDTALHDGANLRLSGTAFVKAIYENAENETVSAEKSLPFDVSFPFEADRIYTAEAEAFACAVKSGITEKGMKIGLEITASVNLYENVQGEYLTKADILADKPLPETDAPPLSLCFAEKGERIWDIAREYGISPRRIKELNNTQGDTVAEKCVLILPRKRT